MSNTATNGLLSEFPAVSYEDWRKLVEAELKGAPFLKKMFTSTPEGITLRPIYRRDDIAEMPHVYSMPGFAPFVRGSNASGMVGRPWKVSQELTFSSPTEFNHAARNSISRGLNALNIVLDKATRDGNDPDWAKPEDVGFGGLSIATVNDLDRALDGIDLEKTFLLIRSGASAMPIAALLVALTRKRKKTLTALRGCIEMDPLGVLSHEGKLPQSMQGAYDEMAALTQWSAERAPHLQTMCVHGRAWHESGASAVQELAFVLAMGVEYLREMNNRGLDVNVVAPRTRFAITVGENFFMEIAKLRALRMLWSRAVQTLGGSPESQRLSLHVRTSLWNKTTHDPYNNLLRTTVEALAGVLGGCDSMQVGAFDEVVRQPDDFSRRIARNTQLVLQQECHLEHVIDPIGGSWLVENLTAELGKLAWAQFQEVWKMGGMEVALRAGYPQKEIAKVAADKLKAVASRKASIVGVNQYANPKEKPLDRPPLDPNVFYKRRVNQVIAHRTSMETDSSEVVLEKLTAVVEKRGALRFEACLEAVIAGATIGEITRALRIHESPCQPITPVCITRAAASYEKLREEMDAYTARAGCPAQVFLCNMGSLKEHKARADFSRGFFSAGGYDVVSPNGFSNATDAANAFAETAARIAVICSTDDKYPALVPDIVKALRAKRPDVFVVLAGYPQDQVAAHKAADVNEFIHLRCDAVAVLKKCHKEAGVER